jgi:peroxiredoxin
MPTFTLPDASGTMHASASIAGECGTLVVFLCNHCPYVVHVADELGRIGADYADRGIGLVGITSNDVSKYPADAPSHMPAFAARHGLTFPYLYDESQLVAQAFKAACTPDFFLFDASGSLVYRGQLDDSRPGNDTPVTGTHLRAALNALLAGGPMRVEQVPSLGCNIKWKQCTSRCGEH